MEEDLKKSQIDNPKEKALNDLVRGKKEPENAFEEDLQKDIDRIKREGREVEIPTDI